MVKLTDKKDFLMQFLRFGKHNGKTFKDVFQEVPEYLEWVIGSICHLLCSSTVQAK